METETSDDGNRRNTTDAPPPMPAEGRQKKRLTVMVAVDESDRSLYALKWTLENLFKEHVHVPGEENPEVEPDPDQGMVTIVHVMEPFESYTFPAEPSMYTSASMVKSVRKAQRENAAQLLSRAFEICKGTKKFVHQLKMELGVPRRNLTGSAGHISDEMGYKVDQIIKAETLILEGDPKEMLCQAVEQIHFDLLVVGSRGLGAIKRAFLGSISDFCAHHAKCPVLIVKPPHK